VVLSISSAALAVFDLTDRIQKRRRAENVSITPSYWPPNR